jgi:prepilin-type N-terminal cleavage/methylation domain-containing protein
VGIERGFTLTEVIIYVAVLAILSSVVFKLGAGDKYSAVNHLNIAAEALKDDIRHIQRLAMAESRQYKIWSSGLNNYNYGYEQPSKDFYIVKAVTLPKGVYFEKVADISFTKRGTVVKAGTLTLRGGNGENLSLTVNVSGGRVAISNF